MMQKSLDAKLARIHADPHGCKDFILADAKDADMALAIGAPGRSPEAHSGEVRYRSLAEFRDIIDADRRAEAGGHHAHVGQHQRGADIHKRLFDNSPVTPAARANDTTDIHIVRGSKYPTTPSLPFRTATLDHIQCGHLDCKPEERHLGANLGLYSITFNNDTVLDREALEEYKQFRLEAERKGFRHFLEIFDPNRPEAVEAEQMPGFINDVIVRTLGGVTGKGRPLFLKMVYHGPKAMEELVHYDPHLVVGILGGSAGTTYDAFKLLSEAKKYGARVALFGRKINNAENQLAFIRFLRLIADGEISRRGGGAGVSRRACSSSASSRSARWKTTWSCRPNVMSYGGNGTSISVPPSLASANEVSVSRLVRACACKSTAHAACACADKKSTKAEANGTVDFTKMTTAQKIAYHKARWDRILG